MIGTDDLSSCDIQLSSEFLAVVLSECCRSSTTQDRSRGNTGSRSGKTLFRSFVKQNSASVWKPTLTDSISTVRFGGFLHDPPTIFLQGSAKYMQSIREAWSSRMLRPPTGYHIDFVGDVTRIGARPLSRGRFIPLSDAVCVTIENVTTRKEIATQEAIMDDITRTFPTVHAPNREAVHDILGKLIRERKIYCTGPGYYLVRKTRNEKKPRTNDKGDGESKVKTGSGRDQKTELGCSKCRESRRSFETEVDMRRSYRVRKRHNPKEQEERTSPTGSVEPEGLHGRVVPDNARDHQLMENDNKRISSTKSPYPEQDDVCRSQGGGFVGKMAYKIFGRKKSSSERRPSDASSTTSPKHTEDHKSRDKITEKVRELNPYEARRRGYLNQSEKEIRKHSRKERSESESPVKEVRSDKRHQKKSQRGRKSKKDREEEATQEQKKSEDNERVKLKNCEEIEHGKERVRRSKSSSNVHPIKRDVAITCKLENNATTSPSDRYDGLTDEARYSYNNKKSLRRSKSLRLPKDSQKNYCESKKMERNISLPRGSRSPPNYHSLKFSEMGEDLAYQTSNHRTRQSISSTSTSREYSFLHASPFAPSFRIGSAIAEHLQELNQRKCKEIDDWKSPGSRTLSTTSTESQTPTHPDSDNAASDNEIVESDTQTENEAHENLDAETKAALHIAKRLAKLGVKMTREEWTDYFATKLLPPHAEKLLFEHKEASDKRESPTSCFEVTSGSVETVIDLTSDEYLLNHSKCETKHDSSTSEKKSSNLPNPKQSECDNSDSCSKYETNFCDISSLKKSVTPRHEQYCSHCARRVNRRTEYSCLCRNCHGIKDDKRNYLDYSTINRTHLPYCCIHNQYISIDNASLTEDSGIYSARERSSLSSWDVENKTSETFV